MQRKGSCEVSGLQESMRQSNARWIQTVMDWTNQPPSLLFPAIGFLWAESQQNDLSCFTVNTEWLSRYTQLLIDTFQPSEHRTQGLLSITRCQPMADLKQQLSGCFNNKVETWWPRSVSSVSN